MKPTMLQSKPVCLLTGLLLLIALIMSLLIGVTMGSVHIAAADVYNVILQQFPWYGVQSLGAERAVYDIIWLLRLPRLVLAVAVGMGLAVCGAVMQAIMKNPLADPYVLGISSGASLGAALAILCGVGTALGANYIGVCAFGGAFIMALAVLAIAGHGGESHPVKLLLTGMALSSVSSAFSSFIVYISNDKDGIQRVTYWLMGSLAGAKWTSLAVIFPVVLGAVMFFWSQSRILNLMLMGDETAVTLGTNLHHYRQAYLVVCALVVGFVVYAAGMIGFVGLLIPHIVRMLFGTDHNKLIPLCALVGAVFLIWADVLCRIILPKTEVPIGVLIALVGAPFFVYLMTKKVYHFGSRT